MMKMIQNRSDHFKGLCNQWTLQSQMMFQSGNHYLKWCKHHRRPLFIAHYFLIPVTSILKCNGIGNVRSKSHWSLSRGAVFSARLPEWVANFSLAFFGAQLSGGSACSSRQNTSLSLSITARLDLKRTLRTWSHTALIIVILSVISHLWYLDILSQTLDTRIGIAQLYNSDFQSDFASCFVNDLSCVQEVQCV